MEITRVMIERDDPDKGQRLATATVVFDGTYLVSGFSVFPDRHRPGKLRVLMPARRINSETVEMFSVLDPTKKVKILEAILDAAETEGITTEAPSGKQS